MNYTILDILMYINLAIAFVITLVIGNSIYMQWRNTEEQKTKE
ncbi:hypothetical protein [uncultured Maribacter sp.]|nr:hypothetical protein [uncultured Maribacter sp.]